MPQLTEVQPPAGVDSGRKQHLLLVLAKVVSQEPHACLPACVGEDRRMHACSAIPCLVEVEVAVFVDIHAQERGMAAE